MQRVGEWGVGEGDKKRKRSLLSKVIEECSGVVVVRYKIELFLALKGKT